MINNREYYQIGDVSKICNISVKTLRYYDEIGLLKPNKIDIQSNYRYYTNDQLTLVIVIKHFKEAGFSLKEIPVSYIAYLRSVGGSSQKEFSVRYCNLISLMEKNKFHLIKNVMAVYYDDCIAFEDKEKTEYDIEVCAPVSENKEIPGLVRKFGGFKALTTIHYGSYNNMIDTYRKMIEYINENNYEICGPAVDNYLVDIISTCDEMNYVTELIIPIK